MRFAPPNWASRSAETSLTERARQKLILALDFPSLDSASELAKSLSSVVGMFKINIHLFTAEGPSAVGKLRRLGPEIFLYLKIHHISNSVAGAGFPPGGLPGGRPFEIHAH